MDEFQTDTQTWMGRGSSAPEQGTPLFPGQAAPVPGLCVHYRYVKNGLNAEVKFTYRCVCIYFGFFSS